MNRRSRARFHTDLSATATCLDIPDICVKARIANLSAHGLSLILGTELPTGCHVKVEWANVAFVGELIYCQPHGDEFVVGLNVDDPVYDTKRSSLKTLQS